MDIKEMRSKSIPELEQAIEDIKKDIEKESDALIKGKSKNTRKVIMLRRNIARVLTVISEKEETLE
jgi:ribosomal protein L29